MLDVRLGDRLLGGGFLGCASLCRWALKGRVTIKHFEHSLVFKHFFIYNFIPRVFGNLAMASLVGLREGWVGQCPCWLIWSFVSLSVNVP